MKKIFAILMILMLSGNFYLIAQCNFKTYSNELLSEFHEGFYVTPKGKVLCRHFDGLSIFDGKNWKTIAYPIPQGHAAAMDDNGVVWLGSFYTGLTKFVDTNNITNYDTSSGLPYMEISFIEIAPDGKIWISHMGRGVSVFDGTTFIKYDTTNGLSEMYINKIKFDKSGKVYLTSWNGTVDVFDGIKFNKLNLPLTEEVNDIAIAENGDIYVVFFAVTNYEYKFYKWDGNKWYQIILNKLGAEPNIFGILTDQANHLYVATSNGLLKYDGKTEVMYTMNDGLFDDYVAGMGITNDGTIYTTSHSGVTEFKQSSSFAVNIIQPNGTTYEGKIVVFKKSSGVKKFVEVLTQPYSTSTAQLTVNSTGDFLIIVVPNQSLNPNLVSTYFGDVDKWDFAIVIQKHFCNEKTDTYTIKVIEIPPMPKGKGYISGTVKSIDGTRAGAEPIKDVDVTLKKVPGGVIVKNTKTNDQGFYEFSELDTATYAIIIDIPGLQQDTPRIVKITATDTSFKNQDYKVDSTGIKAGDFSAVREKRNDLNATVYPNPFRNILNLRFFSNGQSTIEVLNMSGQLIRTIRENTNGETLYSIDFENLPQGLYIVKLTAMDKISLFVVNHQ